MGRAALMGTSHLWQTVPGQAAGNPKKGSSARRRPTANAALSIQLRKVAARATALCKGGAVRPAHVDAPCPASPPPRPAKGGAQAAKRPGGGGGGSLTHASSWTYCAGRRCTPNQPKPCHPPVPKARPSTGRAWQ